jgi:putative endonuclease
VFAEVRMRRGSGFGGAAESVTDAKRARLVAAAKLYLTRRPEAPCRFDVLLVGAENARIEWIRDAFGE